jgi:tRNA1(Val) A37 N6-methylase TrmN6
MVTSICNVLFERLCSRGLTLPEVSRFIRDAFNILQEGGDFTLVSVNEALELIIFLLENEYEYRVERHTLR